MTTFPPHRDSKPRKLLKVVGLPDVACKIQMVSDGSKENIENPNFLSPARCHLNNGGPSLEALEQCMSTLTTLRSVDFNFENSQMARELKSTHLNLLKVEKHCSRTSVQQKNNSPCRGLQEG